MTIGTFHRSATARPPTRPAARLRPGLLHLRPKRQAPAGTHGLPPKDNRRPSGQHHLQSAPTARTLDPPCAWYATPAVRARSRVSHEKEASARRRRRRSPWTTTRRAGETPVFLAKEQPWRTAWRARSLLSRTSLSSGRHDAREPRWLLLSTDAGAPPVRSSRPLRTRSGRHGETAAFRRDKQPRAGGCTRRSLAASNETQRRSAWSVLSLGRPSATSHRPTRSSRIGIRADRVQRTGRPHANRQPDRRAGSRARRRRAP